MMFVRFHAKEARNPAEIEEDIRERNEREAMKSSEVIENGRKRFVDL